MCVRPELTRCVCMCTSIEQTAEKDTHRAVYGLKAVRSFIVWILSRLEQYLAHSFNYREIRSLSYSISVIQLLSIYWNILGVSHSFEIIRRRRELLFVLPKLGLRPDEIYKNYTNVSSLLITRHRVRTRLQFNRWAKVNFTLQFQWHTSYLKQRSRHLNVIWSKYESFRILTFYRYSGKLTCKSHQNHVCLVP